MFLQIVQNLFFLLDLPTVVLGLFVGDLYFKFVVVQLLLLSLDLHAQLQILLLQSIFLLFDLLVYWLLGLHRFVQYTIGVHARRQFTYQLLTLFGEHFQFYFFVRSPRKFIDFVFFILFELRHFEVIHRV